MCVLGVFLLFCVIIGAVDIRTSPFRERTIYLVQPKLQVSISRDPCLEAEGAAAESACPFVAEVNRAWKLGEARLMGFSEI